MRIISTKEHLCSPCSTCDLRDFKSTASRRGTLFLIPNPLFADICTLFSGARGCSWIFLALLAAGHGGGSPAHHGARAGPGRAPWCMLWAFKVVSNRGIAFQPARANQANANPKNDTKKKNVSISLMLYLKYHSSCQRLGSQGTTAALQASVTATNGASAFGFVSVHVGVCVITGSYSSRNQEHS